MRCDACGRTWAASARFCGRCGEQLGAHRADGSAATGTGRAAADADRHRTRRALAGVVLVVVTGALVATVSVLEPSTPDLVNGSDPARTDVSLPSPTPGALAARSTDQRSRPLDCPDHLRDLPRHIRRTGLFTGTLEWRDGQLCARGTSRTQSPTPSRGAAHRR